MSGRGDRPFRRLVRAAVRRLAQSPELRRLGRVLPRRWSDLARSTAGLDRQARELARQTRARLLASGRAATIAWGGVRSRDDWEVFRDVRLEALRRSLGGFPPAASPLDVRVTRSLSGDGFVIENLVFESRPGSVVTANLYRPQDPDGASPGILICHSHHNPKTQDELQDMGATWARCGCTVLIMDQLGHGERRQHPFRDATDHERPFPVDRQDYFFRYNLGMQLQLIGQSLIGWMVEDLMRGVDLLVGRPTVDPSRIILIGSVAGGGDPAAVTAALDRRIAAVVPFGFGPSRKVVVGTHAENDFVGNGSWESTRNLRRSARDGFAPWVILAAVAPRRLIYAHEFAWDAQDDATWTRIARIYDFYGAADHLAVVHGSGSVTGHSPNDTHCNNVGPVHRRQIYPLLERWFGIPVPDEEYRTRRPSADLICLSSGSSPELPLRPVHRLAAEIAAGQLDAARTRSSTLDRDSRIDVLRRELAELLGIALPVSVPSVRSRDREDLKSGNRETVVLEVEPGIEVPTILLNPVTDRTTTPPVVIVAAQASGRALLRARADLIARLSRGGMAVCLPELRGTADAGRGDGFRGRRSIATEVSSSELMLGRTLLGARLHDLLSVVAHLRTRAELDTTRLVVWGDSLAPPNPPGCDLAVPLDAEPFPMLCEPLGGLLALLSGLFGEDVRVVGVSGGSTGFASLLDSPFCYTPHDVIVPGLLKVGDVGDLAAALAPIAMRMEALVDARNVAATLDELNETFRQTRLAYLEAGAAERLQIDVARGAAERNAGWILDEVRRTRDG